ncbi:prepilin-type N-terminal cleavage/methylation domain-containing protein [Zoogloea sp.]|uniref:prepilin-type N-terminal cleavage/methylation domain-containing protein n=1 Tax=Zoogloea sp. TaxID=49181 RepID=UPI002601950D|nr:prepilin-type N-terminal cleavage/methylation domain-containing protein [Zoogloea sp.]MDD3354599.1 prepilin-type N-terminal cleavage/methylation domain-containing protein [Zoogloea sp.]
MRPPSTRPRQAGFTLIEVMVVLVIMGVMATGITLGLDSLRGRELEQALQRLRLVLEATADRASVRGRPIAFELLPDGYRFSALDPDDNWRPLIDPPVFTDRPLPAGLSWSGLRLEGQAEAGATRLLFGTQPPEFQLRVLTPTGEALLRGRANGEVVLQLPGRQRS